MSSKRAVRRRACKGKVRYDSKERAHISQYALLKKYGENMQAYHCKFCGGWHIGHKSMSRKRHLAKLNGR